MRLNLPEITALIGSTERNNADVLSTIIAPVKRVKKDENLYVVDMVFDLEQKLIRFANPVPYNDQLRYKFHYFGNNKAASLQAYLVREVDSLFYLITSVWNDLFLALKQNGLVDSELANIIVEMKNNGLIEIGSKKGEGCVVLKKIVFGNDNHVDFEIDKKRNVIIDKLNNEEYKYNEFIGRALYLNRRNDIFVLVIPVVKLSNGNEIIVSNHPDYLELVKRLNHLEEKEIMENLTEENNKYCFVCHQLKPDVSSEYSTKFDRSGINKIFTTTTINSAKQINKQNYVDNYAMCNKCYQNMRNGEKIISERFQATIAGERALIIPESIMGYFDYREFKSIKDSVDFAFQSKDANDWIENVNAQAYFNETQYVLNFIFYRTDGKSVTILDTIADVPLVRFERLMRTLMSSAARMRSQVKRMSLGSIYRMIPVKINKKHEQIDIGRVLSFYKVLLNGGKINNETLYDYCLEALEKGLKQLLKSKLDNYFNLDLSQYTNGKEDFFIKKIVMSYLVLFHTCHQMNVLDNPIMNIREEEECNVEEEIVKPANITEAIAQMERFVEKQGFNSKAKALFYLGTLINRVAIAQYQKEHKTKPILKKINFQGMSEQEILRLYEDVVEKLQQYKKLNLYTENLMSKFHEYYGPIKEKDEFSEHANVFYLMSGYAYMVGNRAPDLNAKEQQAINELTVEDDTENN